MILITMEVCLVMFIQTSLFSNVDDYYKPILTKIAFKKDESKVDESDYKIGYKLYESRGDKDKNYQQKIIFA